MSGDEFRLRYQLLKKLSEGAATTYLARAANGDRVMIHFLEAGPPQREEILALLDDLTPRKRARVREMEEVQGMPAIVTDYLDDFEGLEPWARRVAEGADRADASSAPDGTRRSEESDEPGEFTRLFEIPGSTGAAEPAEGEPSAPSSDEPGEFTRMFGRPDAAAEEPPAPEAKQEATEGEEGPAAPSSDEPGEFTRMFGRPDAAAEEPPAPEVKQEAPEGEEGPAAGAEEPPHQPPVEPRPPPESSGKDEGPGEFTRMFGSPDEPSDSWSAPRGEEAIRRPRDEDTDGYLDQLRSGPSGGGSSAPAGPPAAATPGGGAEGPGREPPEPEPPASPSGPSEYTRTIQEGGGSGAGASPGAPSGPGRPSAPPHGKQRPPGAGGGADQTEQGDGSSSARWPYVLGLAVIFLAALGLVLVLALGGGEGEANGGTEQPEEAVETTEETAAVLRVQLATRGAAQASSGSTTSSSSRGDGKSEET